MTRYLHLLLLSAFALAQPLLDLLGKNSEFFVIRRFSPAEIWLLLFTLLVLLPLPLLLFIALTSRWGERAQQRATGLAVASLGTAFFMLLGKQFGLDGWVWLGFSLAAGGTFAWGYSRFSGLRQLLSLLSLSLLVIPVLFVLQPGVTKLLFKSAEKVAWGKTGARQTGARQTGARQTGAQVPIIFVLTDELSLTALLNAERKLDAVHFPHLAAFAAQATWFVNTAATSDATEIAVPAILTGRFPQAGQLPTVADHPQNLFTVLGGDYRIWAHESVTSLLPPELQRAAEATSWKHRIKSLVLDLGVIYFHLLLPPAYAKHLPNISDRWEDFRTAPPSAAQTGKEPGFLEVAMRALQRDRAAQFRQLTAALSADFGPQLYFLHILLPHTPWEYLPSGKRYWPEVNRIPGLENERWLLGEAQVTQAYQRYLLQLQFLDRLLGELIERARELALFDDALIIFTADHGVSFRPGDLRRSLSPTNAPDLIPVPLLIKFPHQEEGKVVETMVSSLDILPTIFDVLDLEPPWPMDGQSLLQPSKAPAGEPRFWVKRLGLSTFSPDVFARQFATLDWKFKTLGADLRPEPLLQASLDPALVGRSPAALGFKEQSRVTVQLSGEAQFAEHDPESPWSPGFISGQLAAEPTDTECCELAIAVDDVFYTQTHTFGPQPTDLQFTALVPDSAFPAGSHRVDIYRVNRTPTGLELERLISSRGAPRFDLVKNPAGKVVAVSQADQALPLESGAIRGFFQVEQVDNKVAIFGWAVDPKAAIPPQRILVFYRDQSIYSGGTTKASVEANRSLKLRSDVRSAFHFSLPASWMPELRSSGIRLFGLGESAASELGFFYKLDRDLRGEPTRVRLTNGTEIPLGKACAGHLEQVRREGEQFIVSGWAVDLENQRPAETVLLFKDQQALPANPQFSPRDDIAAHFDNPAVLNAGFKIRLRVAALGDYPPEKLIAVALSDGNATVLPRTE